jgi:uncharacterized protein YukE
MSDITTQQRIGAQREAAQKVLAKKAEFHQHISKVRESNDNLAKGYQGQAASALTNLVYNWAEDADRLVREFEAFAQRLVDTDTHTAASQDEQASTFARSARQIRTSI